MSVATYSSLDVDTLELVHDFVHDATTALREIEPTLMALAAADVRVAEGETVDRILRVFHSLKGGAGFLELTQVERVTQGAESFLDALRTGTAAIDRDQIELLLTTTGFLRTVLARVASEHDDRTCMPAASRVVQDLDEAIRAATGEVPEPVDPHVGVASTAPAFSPVREAVAQVELPEPEPVTTGRTPRREVDAEAPAEVSRVDVERVDALLTLVGELVAAGGAITSCPDLDGVDLPGLRAASARFERIAASVRRAARSLDTVPFGVAFRKLPRLVADVGRRVGKPVEVLLGGESVGLERAIAGQLERPLLHLARNAVDHGIETAEVRAQRGKPETGTIRVEASREGARLRVAVSDDGGGLDRERILERALDLGVVDPAQAWRLRDTEVFDLTFVPGLSAVTEVTELSGRGVGMDAVKRDVEALGGRVEVTNRPLEGTSWVMWIPSVVDGDGE